MGFGWSGQLAVGPIFNPASNSSARAFYENARAIDKSEGRNYPEGATVLAGAKWAKRAGWISAYRWAFGINDVIDTLIAKGPVILGIPWFESMYGTEDGGLVRVNGPQVGGHCILATGYWPNHPVGGNCIQWVNSWGRSYGVGGVGYIRDTDLADLLKLDGEALVAKEIEPPHKKTIVDKFKAVFRND